MKIIVGVKHVPVRDSVVRIDAAGKWIEEQDLSYEINEPDAYALEAALQVKDRQGGEVVLLCARPERAGQTIREGPRQGSGPGHSRRVRRFGEFGYICVGPRAGRRGGNKDGNAPIFEVVEEGKKFVMEERCEAISVRKICRFSESTSGSASGPKAFS
jgi:hypothetical protein